MEKGISEEDGFFIYLYKSKYLGMLGIIGAGFSGKKGTRGEKRLTQRMGIPIFRSCV